MCNFFEKKICFEVFAYLCGIHCADPKDIFSQLVLQLDMVMFPLTINILGVSGRHCIPLATDPHTKTGVITGIICYSRVGAL